jgi:hypothetical protein
MKTNNIHRTTVYVGAIVALGLTLLGLCRFKRHEVDMTELVKDYTRIGDSNYIWRASVPQRAVHYVSHPSQVYSYSITRIPLSNAIASYSPFASKPVYVRRDLLPLPVGPLSVKAYTHEGLVKNIERGFSTNGLVFRRQGGVVIVSGER